MNGFFFSFLYERWQMVLIKVAKIQSCSLIPVIFSKLRKLSVEQLYGQITYISFFEDMT